MRKLLIISLLVVATCSSAYAQPATSPSSIGEDPTCHSLYVGPANGSPLRAAFWTQGIPRPTDVACFPPEAANLAASWPGQVRVLERQEVVAAQDSSQQANIAISAYVDPPAPTAQGGCCLGSSCVESDYFECLNLGGFFRADVFDCSFFNPCVTGACCVSDPDCIDQDLGGGPLDEEICDLTIGTYLGGASCASSDPCQRFRLPTGFEIIEIPGAFDKGWPEMNDCGEVVFNNVVPLGASPLVLEVFRYDNGITQQLTDNERKEGFPTINELGVMFWGREIAEEGQDATNLLQQVLQYDDGEESVVSEAFRTGKFPLSPRVNNLGHAVWKLWEYADCASISDIVFFDGQTEQVIYGDGLTNQSHNINDNDDIVWHRGDLPCECCQEWSSTVMLYRSGVVAELPSTGTQPQGTDINNLGQVTWVSVDLPRLVNTVEVWENGVNRVVADGNAPSINDLGHFSYGQWVHGVNHEIDHWHMRLLRDETEFHLSNIDDPFENGSRNAINNFDEVAWWWSDALTIIPTGVRYMRRIRNGDVTFDGEVDINDFIPLPGCWTGAVETDGLCECRFFDMDHDRDIDEDDFALFMRVYTGPQDDCNGNGILDLTDLIEGTSSDCNLNGVPDLCDISSGASTDLDGDGNLDECCVAPAVSTDTLGTRNRTLAVTTDPSVSQPAAPDGFTYIRHAPPVVSYALRVTLDSLPTAFEAYEGTTMWATAPFEICENSGDGLGTPPTACGPAPGPQGKTMWVARLVCDPALAHYTDWSTLGTVHLFDETIVPGGTYAVQTILEGCGIGFAGNFSAANALPTSMWGDVVTDLTQCPVAAANGNVDLVGDVVSILKKFSNVVCAVNKSRADLEPGHLDFKVNISDVLQALLAFTGRSYPFTPSSPPCPQE